MDSSKRGVTINVSTIVFPDAKNVNELASNLGTTVEEIENFRWAIPYLIEKARGSGIHIRMADLFQDLGFLDLK